LSPKPTSPTNHKEAMQHFFMCLLHRTAVCEQR